MLSTDPGFCCDRPDHRIFSVSGACIAVSSPWIRLLTVNTLSQGTFTEARRERFQLRDPVKPMSRLCLSISAPMKDGRFLPGEKAV
ncbi:hypothetical protein AMELA_G00044130 [Ameiurus melas]|uniref:Uncharacterized protein n=1 Tax=Ameiurus melas TaxID=219545 RepID=A0A7J6B499_AMEME|nr:hypothetical protein AMELA_G00044130 [Ameiurus melas]